ncbi:MAG: GGDEF domain-containing protein [Gemmatimonadota bacterium]
MPSWHFSKPRIPLRAVVLAIAALAVPFIDTTFRSTSSDPGSPLLWLLALVPAFLLAYYRGWQGVATALAAGMAVLSTSVCVALLRGTQLREDLLLPVLACYIAIALAVGFLSELLHAGRAHAELLALTDDLTGLANRRRARMFLESRLAQVPPRKPISVVLFDLDNFKAYNDAHGHPAGDVMLCAFAQVLSETAGPDDLAARYGGEEFLAVLSSSDEAAALAFAEQVRAALRNAQHATITVSAGLATSNGTPASVNDLIVAADRALYQAKEEGRDRVRIAT